jgi:hypothetical protein
MAMKPTVVLIAVVAGLAPGAAFAQQEPMDDRAIPPPGMSPPDQGPPPTPDNPGAPDDTEGAPADGPPEAAPDATGQWTYTAQYGWVWLPYSEPYTYVAPDGGIAYQYGWYPTGGWSWLEAPWILGVGPRPYWGVAGNGRFAWSARPWFRVGVFRGSPGGSRQASASYHGAAPAHGGTSRMHHTGSVPYSPPQGSFGAASHASGGHSGGVRGGRR